jgi:small subunit ribosomal protein S20
LAIHKSAIKRHRQSLRRRSRNRHVKAGVGTLIKNFRSAVQEQDSDGAALKFAAAERAIRKATTKGVIPKKRADRHISRLAKSLNRLASS